MKWTTGTVILIVGALAGWGIREVLDTRLDIRSHWQKIEEFDAFLRNPENHRKQGQFAQTSPPFRIRKHADALVGYGELMRTEIILPELRNEARHIRRWMEFSRDPAIVHAEAPGSFELGEIPLMFTLWYQPSAKIRVRELVDEFESLAETDGESEKGEREPLVP